MNETIEYKVLARVYRPKYFFEVIGQEACVTTLKNAIGLNKVAHAYLFCGSRGCGKTTLARLFAKALMCPFLTKEYEPCNNCPSCKDINSGHSLDVLEIDGASHRGIEDIRQINETIGFVPSSGPYKIYLIDEVHMLTKEAFNALLKTLEEPPSHVKFFFATTEPHKVPTTVLSRCQRFNLKRISPEQIGEKLLAISKDLGVSVDPEAAVILAQLSEGSLRDAESFLDQVLAFQKEKITVQTVRHVLGIASKELLFSLDEAGPKKRFTAAFEIASEVFSSGKNISYFLEELIQHFRTLFLVKQNALSFVQEKARYEQSAMLYSNAQLLEILDFLMEAESELKFASSERTRLEILLLKILRSHQKISLDSLVERLENLEKKLSASVEVPSKPTPPKQKQPEPKAEPPVLKQEIPKQDPPVIIELSKQKNEPQPQIESPKQEKRDPVQQQPTIKPSIQEQSRFDTLMHFTAKELKGSLKKE